MKIRLTFDINKRRFDGYLKRLTRFYFAFGMSNQRDKFGELEKSTNSLSAIKFNKTSCYLFIRRTYWKLFQLRSLLKTSRLLLLQCVSDLRKKCMNSVVFWAINFDWPMEKKDSFVYCCLLLKLVWKGSYFIFKSFVCPWYAKFMPLKRNQTYPNIMPIESFLSFKLT